MLRLARTLLGGGLALLVSAAAFAEAQTGGDVKKHGAAGDGRTDDTAALQRALDRCGETSGGVVFVPTGHYLIKGRLSVPPSVTLEGVWQMPPTVAKYH